MQVHQLGLIDYKKAYDIQLKSVQEVLDGGENRLIVCSHPSVVTLGKKSTPKDLTGWQGLTYEIERGGQATYHGPGQVIVYPIVDLRQSQNISGFLETLEHSMIKTLEHFKVSARGNHERGKPTYTGVWVENKKIASIGIAVKRWVTFHGLALNLVRDPKAFTGINPCGFSSDTMISLDHLIEPCPTRLDFENALIDHLKADLATL